MKTRIFLVDDHQLFRDGLKSMLGHFNVEVVGDADDGRNAARLLDKIKTDAVITDISMPGQNGVEFIKQIRHDFRDLKVLVLSMHKETHFIMESFAAGAAGYVLKDSGVEEIVRALKIILTGRKYIEPEIAGVILEKAVAEWRSGHSCESAKVSNRAREVLQLIAEGKSTKEIAASLYISTKTVETHRRQLMSELKLPTVAQLTKFALREGITSL